MLLVMAGAAGAARAPPRLGRRPTRGIGASTLAPLRSRERSSACSPPRCCSGWPKCPPALRALIDRQRRGQPLLHRRAGQDADRRRRDRWSTASTGACSHEPAAAARMPSTLTGVLQARLDALTPPSGSALQQAARDRPRVLGRRAGGDRSFRARGSCPASSGASWWSAIPRRASTACANTPSTTTCCTR